MLVKWRGHSIGQLSLLRFVHFWLAGNPFNGLGLEGRTPVERRPIFVGLYREEYGFGLEHDIPLFLFLDLLKEQEVFNARAPLLLLDPFTEFYPDLLQVLFGNGCSAVEVSISALLGSPSKAALQKSGLGIGHVPQNPLRRLPIVRGGNGLRILLWRTSWKIRLSCIKNI